MEEIKIKFWSDELQAGLNSIKICFAVINGELVKMKPEVSSAGTLRYRYKKKVIFYSVLKPKLNGKNKIFQEECPF